MNIPIVFINYDIDEAKEFFKSNFLKKNIKIISQIINQDQNLGIDQVRNLQQLLQLSQSKNELYIYIIKDLNHASIAAQNALLKLFEETPIGKQIIATSSKVNNIIDTIISRSKIIKKNWTNKNIEEIKKEIISLANKNKGEIINYCQKFKEREQAIKFIESMIDYYHQQLDLESKIHNTKLFLQALNQLHSNCNHKLVVEDVLFNIKM